MLCRYMYYKQKALCDWHTYDSCNVSFLKIVACRIDRHMVCLDVLIHDVYWACIHLERPVGNDNSVSFSLPLFCEILLQILNEKFYKYDGINNNISTDKPTKSFFTWYKIWSSTTSWSKNKLALINLKCYFHHEANSPPLQK